MFTRLLVGALKGLLVGGALAFVALKLFGSAPDTLLEYALGALTGLLVGLVAGKPIWAQGAKLEALLKAIVGSFAATAGLFALRRWLGWSVDLSAFGLGAGRAAELTAVILPTLGAGLALLLEIDNSVGSAPNSPSAGARESARSRGASGPDRTRLDSAERAAAELDPLDDAAPDSKPAVRKR